MTLNPNMKQLILHTGCDPFLGGAVPVPPGNSSGSLLAAIIKGCAVFNDTTIPVYVDILEPEKKHNSVATDSGAVMYIVAVLVFYSAGIVTMIIKYLKREKQELEEEKALDDFFRSMPAYKKEREQNKVNRVAIHAFHALTSFSYDDVDDDEVTSDEETYRVYAPTIHEQVDQSESNSDDDNSDEVGSDKAEANVNTCLLPEETASTSTDGVQVV